MKRSLLCAAVTGVVVTLAVLDPRTRIEGQRAELKGLSSLFDLAAGAVRDTNGDGLPDAVAARVIVPAEPSIEDIQAAANIAGRLGFETTALTLPIVLRAGDVQQAASVALPILVGRGNGFIRTLAERGALDIKGLKPGQGLVALVKSPLGGADGIAIVGGDDEGTLAAGTELAAHLPRLWGASGARLGQVEAHTARYLKSKGIGAEARGVTAILVDSDRRGIASISVRVDVPAGDVTKVVRAIEDLDAAHRRGLEAETLSYTNAASTDVEVWSGGRKSASARVRRSGLNPRTLTPPQDEEDAAGGRGGRSGAPDAAGGDTPPTGAGSGQPAGATPAAGTAGVGGGAAGAAGGPDTTGVAPRAATPAEGAAGPEGGGPGGAAAAAAAVIPPKTFDLSGAYSLDGWFGDSFVDLIPDRLETTVVVGDPKESLGAAHIATRLGLETTGVTLPLARNARKVDNPAREPNPILVGRSNDLVQQLVKIGKVRLDDLKPGEGLVQSVPRAFGAATATVVAGADAAGTDAAAMYLARRMPFLWDNTRGAFGLNDLTSQAVDFFAVKAGGSQASLALREIEEALKGLEGKTIESFDAKVFLEEANPGFDRFVAARVKESLKQTGAVTVSSEGITDPVPVFEDKIDIPWEVDEFWSRFKADVLPKVKPGSSVTLETRLSESPQIRKGIAEDAVAQLVKAGAKAPQVHVLSAYKQGFLWFTEQVLPQLKGKNVRSIDIKVATHKPDLTKKYRFYMVPTRWLHELYPVDELVERDLGIPKSAFGLELVDDAKDIYTVEALDGSGQVVYKGTFSPKFVEREYLEKFPGWAKVEVTTGWISAAVDGQAAVDTRIATDPERFWDHYQGKVLPRIHDYVMRVTDNRPTADKQPFHRDLDVELWMSEPDFRIGVDEEQISALESLHEDLYFVTLDFFNALGRTTPARARLNAPGKVYPIIHPERAGKPGQARILYAGNASMRPRVDITYKEKGVEQPTRVRRDLTAINVTAPSAVRAVVRADRVSEIELQVEPRDDREALRAADALDGLVRLQAAGLYKTSLSYDHVDRIAFAVTTKDARARRIVPSTGSAPPSNVRVGGAKPRGSVVAWDHVISPDESEEIVGKLAAFPEIKAYKAGRSYRKRDISVMEITLPTASEIRSPAKYSAYKPTIFITGRQHANEVSSTSHILRLAELLATDPSYRDILKKVNVILHPIENPDGAQMAFDLQKLTPNHMLHAGRYSALGADVGSGNPLLPESEVRGKVWREWLPDIYLNPHGYPSHEWVQLFAGYVSPQFRAYWSSRGWYTQLSGVRDPRYPELIASTEALRESIVREINGNPDVRDMNLRHQARYRRWAYGFAPHVFNQEIYKDTAIYFTDPETGEGRGSRRVPATRPGGGGRATMNAWPQVTFNVGMTEAPDETAQGEWLNLVTKAGFSFLMAHVKYLRDGHFDIERIEEAGQRDSVSLTMLRTRPVRPARTGRTATSSGGQ